MQTLFLRLLLFYGVISRKKIDISLQNIKRKLYYYYIPDLYSAPFVSITFKGALHSFATTRAHVHPLPVQIQSDLTRGTDETKSPEERLGN